MSQYSFATIISGSPGLSSDMKALLLKHEHDLTENERETIARTIIGYEEKLYAAAKQDLDSK